MLIYFKKTKKKMQQNVIEIFLQKSRFIQIVLLNVILTCDINV